MACTSCGDDRRVIGWRCWVDGGVYDSTHHHPESLPADGVLLLMLYYPDGRTRVLSGADWFFIANHRGGMIYGSDMARPDGSRYALRWVGRGQWVPDHVMAAVEAEAFAAGAP